MKANTRSISGALLMLVIIPILAGLLACMPEYVPLGNPERARIDPELSGLWYSPGDDGFVGHITFLQPWDKRTWLVVTVGVDLYEDLDPELYDPAEYDTSTYDGFFRTLAELTDEEDVEVSMIAYKAWLVKLGKATFFTWEWRGIPHPEPEEGEVDDPLAPWFWLDFRLEKEDPNRIVLRLIDPEFPALKEAEPTRKAWERVIRKHLDDEDLYEVDAVTLERIRPEDIEVIPDILQYAFIRDGF